MEHDIETWSYTGFNSWVGKGLTMWAWDCSCKQGDSGFLTEDEALDNAETHLGREEV